MKGWTKLIIDKYLKYFIRQSVILSLATISKWKPHQAITKYIVYMEVLTIKIGMQQITWRLKQKII